MLCEICCIRFLVEYLSLCCRYIEVVNYCICIFVWYFYVYVYACTGLWPKIKNLNLNLLFVCSWCDKKYSLSYPILSYLILSYLDKDKILWNIYVLKTHLVYFSDGKDFTVFDVGPTGHSGFCGVSCDSIQCSPCWVIYPSYNSHCVSEEYTTMLHFVTEMYTHGHILVTTWALWDMVQVHCEICYLI